MSHLVERGLQQVSIVLKCFVCIVEQAQGCLIADVAAPQQKRQHEAR